MQQPAAGLTYAAGNLYGTTWDGGTGCQPPPRGTIFKLTPGNGSWTESIVYNFDGDWGGGKDDSGGQPWLGGRLSKEPLGRLASLEVQSGLSTGHVRRPLNGF